jgi:hypothetical protein
MWLLGGSPNKKERDVSSHTPMYAQFLKAKPSAPKGLYLFGSVGMKNESCWLHGQSHGLQYMQPACSENEPNHLTN